MDERGDRLPVPDDLPDGEEMDEVAATRARARFRAEGITPVATVDSVAPLLRPRERIFANHSPALVRRRTSPEALIAPPTFAGDLYLTSQRLILVGPTVVEADIEDIEQAVLAGGQLLLVLRRGVGLALEVDQPHLLRVQIAAARAVARES